MRHDDGFDPAGHRPNAAPVFLVPVFATLVLLAALGGGPALGQTYPAKPIRVIIPFAGGGVVDVLMRTVNQLVSEPLGQPVLVDNRPGASSQITLLACAKAPPDGYTLCVTSGEGMSFGPFLFPKLPYDTENDFAPITNLIVAQGVIATNKDVPFNNMKEMIAYARTRPGALNIGSWGVASLAHIYLEWIKHRAGVNILHVPYRGGSAPVVPALLAGEIHVSFLAMGAAMSDLKAGRLKTIAVTTSQRSRYFPDVPTLAEDDLDPGVKAWFGLFAPARTPKPVIDRLNAEYVKAVRDPGLRERFLDVQAYDPAGSSPAEFVAFLKADRAYAGRVVKLIDLRSPDAGSKPPAGAAAK